MYSSARSNLFSLAREEQEMNKTRRNFAVLALAGAFVVPIVTTTQAAQEVKVRVYDSNHKDYHEWNDNENGAWVRFQGEKHWKEHEFAKASKKQQSEYWDWRHSHPD
jgi:hypothetical protein